MSSSQIASRGIALGHAYNHLTSPYDIINITTETPHQEIDVLSQAIELSTAEITDLKSHYPHDDKAVFDAHILILKDPELMRKTITLINENYMNAAFAFKTVTDQYITHFNTLKNTYFKLRASDIMDIQRRVLNHLIDNKHSKFPPFNQPTIIIADTLTPSDIAQLDLTTVKGLITEDGGLTSHVAIMAQALNIPLLIRVKGVTNQVPNNTLVLLDCDHGTYTVNPDQTKINGFKKERSLKQTVDPLKNISMHIKTKDNHHIHLKANIAHPKEWEPYKNHPSLDIGLLRTEFMYFNEPALPSIDKHINLLTPLFTTCHDVTVRTMDIGSDKPLAFIDSEKEDNPALGLRGIRYTLANKAVFTDHLKSLLRASANQPSLKLMLPMVTSLKEIKETKQLIEKTQTHLQAHDIPYQNNITLGIMIETPIAAFNVDSLSQHVDFFSIGTNDLLQYVFASDRINTHNQSVSTYFEPSFLALLKKIIEDANKADTPISVCGEMAHNHYAALILIGLGVTTLSMTPNHLKDVQAIIQQHTYKALHILAETLLTLEDSSAVLNYLKKYLKTEM